MAKQVNNLVSGQVGPYDFFTKGGKQFLKPRATRVRQTIATKQQAGVFGQASRAASLLWTHLKPWSAGYANEYAWNRLNRAIANCVRVGALSATTPQNNLPYICGFQFNTATVLNERLRFAMQVNRTGNGALELLIPAINPAQQIAAPAGTRLVALKILALTVTTNNTTVTEQFSTELQIPYSNSMLPAQQVALPVTPYPAAITVVAVAVAYHTSENMQLPPVDKPVWMPAAIVDALFN